eukprot:CAMPEP_0194546224 /NCGR_PEP_ID=MMETSP0253-20130528/90361_1 /TAXON_ID=2966 /ORGANISM="Noctiluca scintillans" /LENGTH=259 /DNA_ID=CAMNT_0039393297 /DNA_START=79 /DNA_END=855 /DNA_ORIENTATION=+
MSLREGVKRNRSFLFQYCEVEGLLKFDEWEVHPQPAFSTVARHDSVSIEDTVMCGVLIRRCPRYYIVNIMAMLCFLTLLAFAIYLIDVSNFWERAEVFLGIYPLIVIFKLSAQGKLPKVNYSTRFDQYASDCQFLFHLIIAHCMISSLVIKIPVWFDQSCNTHLNDEDLATMLRSSEKYVLAFVLVSWASWNARFAQQSWKAFNLEPRDALRTHMPLRLQDDEFLKKNVATVPSGTHVKDVTDRCTLRPSMDSVASAWS